MTIASSFYSNPVTNGCGMFLLTVVIRGLEEIKRKRDSLSTPLGLFVPNKVD